MQSLEHARMLSVIHGSGLIVLRVATTEISDWLDSRPNDRPSSDFPPSYYHALVATSPGPIEVIHRTGDPASEVSRTCLEHATHLIVVAPSFARSGAVITSIARSTGVPTLVARVTRNYKVIVAAVDLQDIGRTLLLKASRFALRFKAELVVVHNVASPQPVDWANWHQARQLVAEPADVMHAAALLREFVVGIEGITDTVVTTNARAADAVMGEARKRNAELIVVGTHPPNRASQGGRGSIAARLVSHAAIGVLVIPLAGEPNVDCPPAEGG